ncbi:MAG: phage terminase large subunit family protein [Candidatus Scalindua sp.]|nr:phage terminase large subunit family protein [Candidatus Scalindua sp.]
MSYTSAYELRRAMASMVRPPERLTVAQASTKYVKVRTASGAVIPWDESLTPYMVEPMNSLISRDYDSVIFVGPAQSGKTQGLITCFMAYVIKCDPADMMILQTTKDTARDFDLQVVKRTHRDSPALASELAPGTKSNNTFDKIYRAGNILFQAWPSISKLSGKPIKYMLLTDYDRMAPDIDKEGSPYYLSSKRTSKFLKAGMTLVETSPGYEVTDGRWTPHSLHEAPPCGGALSLYNLGDRRRYYVKCPHCNCYFMPNPGPEGLSFDHERDNHHITILQMKREVMLICTVNGCLIEEKHKRKMNANGLWLSENGKIVDGQVVKGQQTNRIASFWFPGVFAAYSNWNALAQKYLNGMREYDVSGIEENLKTCVNVDFSCPYLRMKLANNISATDYLERAELFERGIIHSGIRFIIASIDVQSWGFSVLVLGFGIDLESWVVDRYEIRIAKRLLDEEVTTVNPASYSEDWMLIKDQVLEKRYPLDDGSGRSMGFLIVGSDSGGREGVTENAYRFWKLMKREGYQARFKLLKGERPKPESNNPMVRITHPDKTSEAARKAKVIGQLELWLLNTTTIKDAVAGSLQRMEKGRDYVNFPDWLTLDFYEELTAEVRTEKGWSNPSRLRNEAFDLFCYIKALLLIKMKDHWESEINWNRPPAWAKEWDDNSLVYKVDGNADNPEKKLPSKRRIRMRSKQ